MFDLESEPTTESYQNRIWIKRERVIGKVTIPFLYIFWIKLSNVLNSIKADLKVRMSHLKSSSNKRSPLDAVSLVLLFYVAIHTAKTLFIGRLWYLPNYSEHAWPVFDIWGIWCYSKNWHVRPKILSDRADHGWISTCASVGLKSVFRFISPEAINIWGYILDFQLYSRAKILAINAVTENLV